MKGIAAFLAGLALCGAAAAEQAYECALKPHSRYGWIPPVLVVSFDESSNTAVVFDGFIKQIVGKPISARFTRRDAKSIKLEWTLKKVPLSNQRQTLDVYYRAILRTNTGRISLVAYLSGGSDIDPPTGSGTCKPLK